jgi:hypothetical protein
VQQLVSADMSKSESGIRQCILVLLAGVLILKVTLSVMLGYGDYFPPNFQSDFLRGRRSYFFGAYQWAFYAHIASGPVALMLGLTLVSERFRLKFPRWHRSLGKVQAALVLFVLAPSGLWMAYYADTGSIAATGFSFLAIATGTCVLLGWQAAVKKRFAEHRRWMSRCFLLLCSAVILRLIGGLSTVTNFGVEWSYPLAAWMSWLAPLFAYEIWLAFIRPFTQPAAVDGDHSAPSSITLSLPAIDMSARRDVADISSWRNATPPSTNAPCTPPGCDVREFGPPMPSTTLSSASTGDIQGTACSSSTSININVFAPSVTSDNLRDSVR